MSEKNDYSWGKERVTSGSKLGHIVSIPLEPEDRCEETKEITEIETDVVIEDFKEKMAKMVSKEIHKSEL